MYNYIIYLLVDYKRKYITGTNNAAGALNIQITNTTTKKQMLRVHY